MVVNQLITCNFGKSPVLIKYAKSRLASGTKPSHPRVKHMNRAFVMLSSQNKYFPSVPRCFNLGSRCCAPGSPHRRTSLYVYAAGNVKAKTSPCIKNCQGARRVPEVSAVRLHFRVRPHGRWLHGHEAKHEKRKARGFHIYIKDLFARKKGKQSFTSLLPCTYPGISYA